MGGHSYLTSPLALATRGELRTADGGVALVDIPGARRWLFHTHELVPGYTMVWNLISSGRIPGAVRDPAGRWVIPETSLEALAAAVKAGARTRPSPVSS